MFRTRLVSSDMNGTFTGPTGRLGHTMSHMIAVHAGEEAFKAAKEVFDCQTSGEATMQEAFGNAAPHYKGMTLREAVEYAIEDPSEPLEGARHIKYVAGFWELQGALSERGMEFLVNSTGYDVTVYAVQEQARKKLSDKNPIVDFTIGNHLLFDDKYSEAAKSAEPGLVALPFPELFGRQTTLRQMVELYFRNPAAPQHHHAFDEMVSTG